MFKSRQSQVVTDVEPVRQDVTVFNLSPIYHPIKKTYSENRALGEVKFFNQNATYYLTSPLKNFRNIAKLGATCVGYFACSQWRFGLTEVKPHYHHACRRKKPQKEIVAHRMGKFAAQAETPMAQAKRSQREAAQAVASPSEKENFPLQAKKVSCDNYFRRN